MEDNDQPQQQPQPGRPVEKPREIPVVPIRSREQLNEGVESSPKGNISPQQSNE